MRAIAALLGLALAAVTARAEADNARDWIDRMAAAGAALQYRGMLVYQHGEQLDAMQVERVIGPNGPRESLLALTGDGRELVREAGEVRCVTPGGAVAVDDKAAWPLRAEHAGRAAFEHYEVAVVGAERIAGREAVLVDARALDGKRFGYRLAIDRASGMLLGSVLVAPDGRIVERMMFIELEIAAAAPAAPAAAAPAAAPATVALPAGWRIAELPAGFRMVADQAGPVAGGSHWLFTDGIASLSIYVEAAPQPGFSGAAQRGAVHAYGRRIASYNVVVMGDLPPDVIESIARSVAHDAGGSP